MAKKTVEQTAAAVGATAAPGANVEEMRKKLEAEKAQAMSDMFGDAGAVKVDRKKRLGAPPLLKPEEIPVGKSFVCKIIEPMDSLTQTVKGKLLRVEHTSTSGVVREFSLPVTGTMRQALAPGKANDDKDLLATLAKFNGKKLTIVRGPDGWTNKHGGKAMYTFDVYVE